MASNDNVGIARYDILRNGAFVQQVTTPYFIDDYLNPATTYSYTVVARDASGNVSSSSAVISATTTN
ncbi:MAG: hypothetical protein JXA71_02960 [Chitinispirillaceae bacterium]|nr:hypothetical protein [Chitinispirillaceae bacterium]